MSELQVKFAVGQQKVTLFLPTNAAHNDCEMLRHLFEKEHIPCYLHDEIMSCVTELTHQAANQRDHVASDLLLDPNFCFEQGRHLAYKICRTTKWANDTVMDENDVADTAFIEAYEEVVKSPQAAKEIRALEKSFAAALAELMHSKAAALSNLHKRQSREMETLIARSQGEAAPAAVEKLVAKHVQEVAALERRWDAEAADSKRQQRRDYRADVLELVAEMQRRRSGAAAADSRPLLTRPASRDVVQRAAPQPSSPPSAPSNGGGASNKLASSVARSARSLLSFGRRGKAALSSSPNDKPASPPTATTRPERVVSPRGTNSAEVGSAATADNGATRSDATGDGDGDDLEEFRIRLGSQLKNSFDVQLVSGDALDVVRHAATLVRVRRACTQVTSLAVAPQKRRATRSDGTRKGSSVYSDSLSGIVLLVDAGLKLHSKQCQEFASLCHASTEFHFDSFDEQLARVREETAANGALRTGEFFITRHSTLDNVHVVFHLVGQTAGADAALDTKAALLRGLRNILALAAQYDVTSLTLPVLLVDRGAEVMFSEQQMLKRAQTVLFAVKSSLQLHARFSDNPLRFIRFVAPRNDALRRKFRELLG